MCTRLESDVAAGKEFYPALQELLREIVHTHKRVLFDGDNYTQEWKEEAARRGLPNLITTPEALEVLGDAKTAELFGKYGVLSECELHSRHEVYKEVYEQILTIEATCMCTMANTMLVPAAFAYAGELAETSAALQAIKAPAAVSTALATQVATAAEALSQAAAKIAATEECEALVELMKEARAAADELEGLVPSDRWPLPSYADMMFLL
jgi:glutamine synthetase